MSTYTAKCSIDKTLHSAAPFQVFSSSKKTHLYNICTYIHFLSVALYYRAGLALNESDKANICLKADSSANISHYSNSELSFLGTRSQAKSIFDFQAV